MDNWEALDAFCQEWPAAEPAETDAGVLARLQAAAADLATHEAALHIAVALEQIRDRALGGRGEIVQRRSMYGIEGLFSLLWPAAVDPRPERAAVQGDYHVSVWLGYHDSTGRACVRVLGEKRLEALLPVSHDKLRGAIIAALRAPAFTAAAPSPASPEPAAGVASDSDEPSG